MTRVAALLAALALLLALGPAAAAQDDDSIIAELDDEIQILRVDQDDDGRVTLQIAVPVAVGELIPTQRNFGITDAGELINTFEVSAITTAVDAVVVLDTSGSMSTGSAMEAAKRAAARFIDELPRNANVGLVSFADAVTVHQEPSTDRQSAVSAVDGLSASGETALWDALVAAADLVSGAEQPFVIVLSDGDDTVSANNRDDAITALQLAEASLYAIALETDDSDLLALEEAADQVGGQFLDDVDTAQLETLYAEIAGRLGGRYELSYETGRTTERDLVVSVAVDGAVARASTRVGVGVGTAAAAEAAAAAENETDLVLNVPEGSRLGQIPAPSPGVFAGRSVLWVGAGLLFLAFLTLGVLMSVPQANQVRLNTAASVDRVAGVNSRLSAFADRFIARRDDEAALDKALDAAGMNLRPGEFVLLTFVASVVTAVAFSSFGGSLLGGAMIPVVVLLAFAYLSLKASRRRAKFGEQMVDTLGIMVGGLRAGRGLPQAIEMVGEETSEPTASQFQRIAFETRVGRDMTESILGVADRMQSQDLDWAARAIDINRELGGDLTEALENVVSTIRERRRVARQVQALSAEGRASGWVLMSLPIIMFLFNLWRSPDNARLLFTEPAGRVMLSVAVGGMVIGYFWIRRLVNIKY